MPMVEYYDSKFIILSRIQLGDQQQPSALLEMKALMRLPETTPGTPNHLDLLCVLWLLRMPLAIRAGIENYMEASEEKLLQLADSL